MTSAVNRKQAAAARIGAFTGKRKDVIAITETSKAALAQHVS